MSEPNAKDRELAEQFVYYLRDESDLEEGDDLPVAMDIATYRLEIEAATREKVLAEVEAELRKIHDMLMPIEAQMFARLRGTP